jgi:ketosteroid isomerase-like protein
MKSRRLLIGAFLLFVIPSMRVQGQTAAERELLKLENDWSTAWQKKDGAFLQRFYADEYLFTDSDGITWNKADDIKNVTSPSSRPESFQLTGMNVHIYGDTAVVTGQNAIAGFFDGEDISGIYRFTDVFVRRSGRWQIVATQSTLVTKG